MSTVDTSSTPLTPLEKAQQKLRELRASGDYVAPVRLTPVEKAAKNPKSLRAAITAHCWTCVGQGADPNPRQSVRDCNVLDCSLHPVRPWQKVLGKSADQMTEEEIESAALNGDDAADEDDEDLAE